MEAVVSGMPGQAALEQVMPILKPEKFGLRLDQTLLDLGIAPALRAARRMIADGTVRLNGTAAKAGRKIRQGDLLTLEERQKRDAPKALLLQVCSPFYIFFKPAGLHTTTLAGRHSPSLQDQIPQLPVVSEHSAPIILLQRLDYATSGLVLGCDSPEAEKKWRDWENDGLITKTYLAKLCGRLEEKITVKNALDCNGAKRVRVMDFGAPELLWTEIEPLFQDDGYTWALCRIKKGQRHQIRAHAQAAGFPLAGDDLYGGRGDGGFCLRQVKISWPGYEFVHNAHCAAPGTETGFRAYFRHPGQTGLRECTL